jgi:hypothetical protein
MIILVAISIMMYQIEDQEELPVLATEIGLIVLSNLSNLLQELINHQVIFKYHQKRDFHLEHQETHIEKFL